MDRDQWRIQGRGSKGPAPPLLFLDQTEDRRAEKIIFYTAPPPLTSGSGWTGPPFSEGLDPLLETSVARRAC